MNNWREIDSEPNSPAVQSFLRRRLASAKSGRVEDARGFLKEFVSAHTVLDIGVVGHTIERSEVSDWRHDFIIDNATRVVGIDILEAPVLELQKRGYDVRLVDATSDVDLGERFDRIVLGDVIEHVDNPVALLRFASRHLLPGGRIMCTTPNPFYVGNLRSILRKGSFIANAEHVSWITPTMALEISCRAGVNLHSYRHFSGGGHNFLRKSMIALLKATGLVNSELFARSYIYVFEINDRS